MGLTERSQAVMRRCNELGRTRPPLISPCLITILTPAFCYFIVSLFNIIGLLMVIKGHIHGKITKFYLF